MGEAGRGGWVYFLEIPPLKRGQGGDSYGVNGSWVNVTEMREVRKRAVHAGCLLSALGGWGANNDLPRPQRPRSQFLGLCHLDLAEGTLQM